MSHKPLLLNNCLVIFLFIGEPRQRELLVSSSSSVIISLLCKHYQTFRLVSIISNNQFFNNSSSLGKSSLWYSCRATLLTKSAITVNCCPQRKKMRIESGLWFQRYKSSQFCGSATGETFRSSGVLTKGNIFVSWVSQCLLGSVSKRAYSWSYALVWLYSSWSNNKSARRSCATARRSYWPVRKTKFTFSYSHSFHICTRIDWSASHKNFILFRLMLMNSKQRHSLNKFSSFYCVLLVGSRCQSSSFNVRKFSQSVKRKGFILRRHIKQIVGNLLTSLG